MKLPNGYGSVHKLSGKRRNPWRVRKTDGYQTINGITRQKYITIGYYSTQKEALQALADYNKDPYDLHLDTITFGELYNRWSEEHFKTVSQSNVNGYKAAFKLCEKIENMNIHEIKLDHLQKISDESGKNYPTLRKLKVLLGLVYDYGVKHEIIDSNKRDIIRYIDIKKAGNPNSIKRTPFTHKEIKLLWNSVESNELLQLPLILIYTGLRVGEFWNLRKEDVHIDERWFYVRQSKTKSGIREVPIAEKIVPFFNHWMGKNSEWMFCTNQNSKFLDKNFRDAYWKPMMDTLKMDHRPHDTRHTCISLLTEKTVDERIIKQIVGHKGQGVTQTVYTHLELPIKLEAINKI